MTRLYRLFRLDPAPGPLRLAPGPLTLAVAAVLWFTLQARAADPASAPAARSALAVNVVQPRIRALPLSLSANGSIAAWQEASVGAEANGLRLARVLVAVGDAVQRGQLLAQFADETVRAELAQARAAAAEAEAALAEAAANAARARQLQGTDALSAQQQGGFLTAERTAQARVDAARAAVQAAEVRLAHTEVRAPDAGVISARMATLGAVMPAGQELFRLIRQNRLEWRAEVPAAEMARLKAGTRVSVTPAGGAAIEGRVRMVAPTVDAQTRNGLVYVDLPHPGSARAGMFAQGRFELGEVQGLALPQSAVLLRDGFAYAMRVGAQGKVIETRIAIGQRSGEWVQVTGGLAADAQVVASGIGFLADGDTVRVVAATPKAADPAAAIASGAAAASAPVAR